MKKDAPLPLPAEVLQQYGRTMLAVQVLERMLAMLVVTVTRRKSKRTVLDGGLEEALDRVAKRMEHAFHKASATELAKLLPQDFDESLLGAILELLPVRNRLAHLYLAQQLLNRGTDDPVVELRGMQERFEAVAGRINTVQREAASSFPPIEVPTELREAVRKKALPLFFGNASDEG